MLHRALILSLTALLLPACTQQHALQAPLNPGGQFYGTRFEKGVSVEQGAQASLHFASQSDCRDPQMMAANRHFRVDQPLPLLASQTQFDGDLPLSPGDMVDLDIASGEGFSGRYVINPDGRIQLPLLPALMAQGLTSFELAEKIELNLVRAEMFRPATARASVRVLLWAPVEVFVAGAVFEPGRVLINDRPAEKLVEQRLDAYGDYSPTRYVSEALRAASGIRPDAKLDQILLIRQGWRVELDMQGVFSGAPVNDLPLVAGDRIVVPTTGCFQKNLVRPSQITPKGFRVFMSNLIVPAENNSAAAVGRFSSSLPYGSRLLQAAVSANCTGGASWTNAPRKVVLASTNPLTGQIEVIERSIEQLIRQAHREDINPYLMPNDALACYDSDITNLRDIARTLIEVISPLKLL